MIIINPSIEILTPLDGGAMLERLERAGRTCYKSENKIGPETAKSFVAGVIKSGHHSVIEHESISVKIICDRGVTHELVRHRLASFSQESTRYVNYGKSGEITVIKPLFWDEGSKAYKRWYAATQLTESFYLALIKQGATPEQARTVLPNSLKAEIIMTANLREWRHVLDVRCHHTAHPQIREVCLMILEAFSQAVPVVFDDLAKKYLKGEENEQLLN